MKFKVIIAAFAAALLIVLAFFQWNTSRVLMARAALLDRQLTATYFRAGLKETDVTRVLIERKRKSGRRYAHMIKEYRVDRFSFSPKKFKAALEAKLPSLGCRLAKSDRAMSKGMESNIFTVNYGKFDILTLKFIRRKTSPAVAPSVKKFRSPKVAIVIDDFGYSMKNIDDLVNIEQPLTLSILPNQRYSREVARVAHLKGDEVILHLPLEAKSKDVVEEADTIKGSMPEKEVLKKLESDINSVPGIGGVSNHTGSKATEDKALMTIILKRLKEKKLYFFDSLTSEDSVCSAVASSVGIRCAKRDIFLDNESDANYIRKQMMDLRDFAFKNGSAIAICHDRKNTMKVLRQMLPELESEGIDFVYLSEMVK
ncbi:MAG: divergent polysaccharide deacetylase family protein [Candidatus Omnitrophota bacterium]|jgi:hypothetical protein